MPDTLLPPSASKLERAAEAGAARISAVPAPVAELWNPDTCPLAALPWLAWALSVDDWDPAWTEAQKRQVIRQSVYVHQHKGTLAAVKAALAAFDYTTEVVEWFRDTPEGDPYTFKVIVYAVGSEISDNAQDEIARAVNAAKNVRSQLTAIQLVSGFGGDFYIAGAAVGYDMVDIYP